jgi:hypothetical protein
MLCRLLALTAGLVAATLALTAQTPAATLKAAKKAYTPPKTPWAILTCKATGRPSSTSPCSAREV